jgi:peptide/nickel transport system ATP-binding protein
MDEPTTGLDVTTQAHILRTVRDLCDKQQVAIIYVSHDLAVVARLADRVLVIYAGRVVETGPTGLLDRPAHPYTRGLVGAIPVLGQARRLMTIPGQPPRPGHHPPGCRFANRCEFRVSECDAGEPELASIGVQHSARCIRAHELSSQPLAASAAKPEEAAQLPRETLLEVSGLAAAYGSRAVLRGVSFQLHAQECVALVGESGSGKTTLGRCLAGLHANWDGEVTYLGEPLHRLARKRSRQIRQRLQFIFQSPYNALNPRRTVGESVGAPLAQFYAVGARERHARVMMALEQVSLSTDLAQRFPDQLSGGERQRVAIARALVCEPQVLICDEVTSALDVSVQASIVRLLAALQVEEKLAIIFITHNLALVRSIAERVLVLNDGSIVESGPTGTILDAPADPYTRALIADTPTLDHDAPLGDDVAMGDRSQIAERSTR